MVNKNVKWYALSFILVLIVSLLLIFKHNLQMKYLDYKIMYQDYQAQGLEKELSSTKDSMNAIQKKLIETAKQQIVDEKNYCESSQYAFYLKEFQKNDVYPSQLDLDILKLKISTEYCSLETVKQKVTKDLKTSFDAIFNEVDAKGSQFEQALDKEISTLKEQEKVQTEVLEDKYAILDKASGVSDEKYEPKSKTQIKAIFCSYGHGFSSRISGAVDNGYVGNKNEYSPEVWAKLGELMNTYGLDYMKNNYNQGMITEREMVEFLNTVACGKIKQEAEKRNIKFYSIGDPQNPMSLADKIELINKISLENGYDGTNSIAYELHSNSVANPDKSGLEVFYSSKKMKNNGMQSRDLALTVLNAISQTHDKLNGDYNSSYVVKPDHHSKHAYLGFTTLTKPNAVLIEYGFKKNFTDLSLMISHREEIGQSIAQGILNFLP